MLTKLRNLFTVSLSALAVVAASASYASVIETSRCGSGGDDSDPSTNTADCYFERNRPFGNQGDFDTLTGESLSSANLATGQLKSTNIARLDGARGGGIGISATTEMADVLTFNGSFSDPFIVILKLIIDGNFSATGSATNSSFSTNVSLQQRQFLSAGFTNVGWQWRLDDTDTVSINESGESDDGSGDVTVLSSTPSDLRAELTLTRELSGIDPTFSFYTRLDTSAGVFNDQFGTRQYFTSTNDFGNTASFSLIAPAGISFTSQSGRFLTNAPSAVPTPASIALLGLGLAILGWSRRRRYFLD